MDIPCLEIWGHCFPYSDFRVEFLNLAPCRIPNASAMDMGRNKQQIKIPPVTVCLDDAPASLYIPEHDAVYLAALYGLFDRFTGNDLSLFLKMLVPPTELFQSAIIKSFLIIQNKLLSVLWLKWYEFHFFVRHILFPRFHDATSNYTLEVPFVEPKPANFRKLQISYRRILRCFKDNSSIILETFFVIRRNLMDLNPIVPHSKESHEANHLMQAYAAAEKVDLYSLMLQSRKGTYLLSVHEDNTFCGCCCLFPYRSALSAICLLKKLHFADRKHQDNLLAALKEKFPQYQIYLDIKIYE